MTTLQISKEKAKEQRRQIYWAAYCVLESGEWHIQQYCNGVCHLLFGIADIDDWSGEYIIGEFPEFYDQKPKDKGYFEYWWSERPYDMESRQKALLKAIELTYK